MKINEIVENIAFGKDQTLIQPGVGLYLSPEAVYLAETRLNPNGAITVDHLIRIPIPVDKNATVGTASMTSGFLSDPTKVAGAIRQSMAQKKWRSNRIRVTLSHHLGLLRYFILPPIERRFLKSAVPVEAKKHIPIPFDALAHDFQSEQLPADGPIKGRLGILIAVTQRKNIENLRALAKALDMKLSGLEVAPCSVLRLWQAIDPPKDKSSFAHVHMDGGSVRIMVVERGLPMFFREVFLGNEITPGDMRRIDLNGCLGYVRKQFGSSVITQLRVSGNIPNIEAIRDAFIQETALRATIQDTPKLLGLKAGDWGAYAALGASTYGLTQSPITIDLDAPDRITEDDRQVARDVIFAGVGLALFLSISGVVKSATYSYKARDLHEFRRRLDPDVAAALKGMSPAQIDTLLGEMQKQVDQLRLVTGMDRPALTALLKDIIDQMPEKVWLSNISASDKLQGGGGGAAHLLIQLQGHAADQSIQDEQTHVYRFKEALVKNSRIGKMFDIQVQIMNAGGNSSRAGAGVRTSFTMTMKSR